jgi:large subunit ribosomal protein L9
MKVLLRQDVPNLGVIGDIVDVKTGYARNYLLPQHVATAPTPVNLKRVQEEKVACELAAKQRLETLKAIAAKLSGMSVTIKAKANELGHLFGSVTEEHIAEALAAEGYKVAPTQVALAAPIRTLDKFRVPIRLAEGVEAEVDVWVVPAQ